MKPHPYGGERMDRILRAVLVVLAVGLVIFLAAFLVNVVMGMMFWSTYTGTYEYRVSIAPDTTLRNVTFYLPLPSRGAAASPVLLGIGAGALAGVPPGWKVSPIGTEKFTMMELTGGELSPNPDGRPTILSLNLSSGSRVGRPLGTRNPAAEDFILGSVEQAGPVACRGMDTAANPGMQCRVSTGRAYADFSAPGDAHLNISLSLTGRNSWDVFGASSNEFRDSLQFSFSGRDQGWQAGEGLLVSGIGDYRPGDYWQIPVRPSGGEITWTQDTPPHGRGV
jgi:hypothetical protein